MARFEMLLLSVFYLSFVVVNAQNKDFVVPNLLVEALTPRGLRISIPDREGIKSFAFHGKINKELVGREDGIFSKEVTKAVDGRWTFLDKAARPKIGDVIYYWIKIDVFNGERRIAYFKENQSFTISELIYDETVISTVSTTGRPTISTTPYVTTTKKPVTKTTTKATTTETPSCRSTPTLINGKPTCQGKLIFQDTFGELSEKRWMPEIKFAGDPDYEFAIYHNDTENLYIEKAMLNIQPTLIEDKFGVGYVSESEGLDLGENCTGLAESSECQQKPKAWLILPPTLSAQVTTRYRFSFLYGVVEIRAKLPKGDWIYPQLYLKSKNDDYGSGYDSGLIKIAFTPGNEDTSKVLAGGCVLGHSGVARNYALRTIHSDKNWNNDFHIYKLQWKTDSITLSVDNQVYGNIYPPDGGFASEEIELEIESSIAQRWKKGSELAPFDKEMYLVLGVGVGGQCFPDRKTGTKPWDNDDPKAQLHFYRDQDNWMKTWSDNSKLIVDYVKVWAL